MAKKKKLTATRIRWRDHNSVNGWARRGSYKPTAVVVDSLGWLLEENDEAVLLAMSVTGESACEYLSILKECIIDRWEI